MNIFNTTARKYPKIWRYIKRKQVLDAKEQKENLQRSSSATFLILSDYSVHHQRLEYTRVTNFVK
jgi:hypothetical protein